MQDKTLLTSCQTPAAILPSYTPAGDGVEIISPTGTRFHAAISVRTCLRRLARTRALDLSALKHYSKQVTGQRILHTLPISQDLLLVPVKVRTPRVSRDNCTGYINACCVTAIRPSSDPPYKAIIVLQSGDEVPALWTALTLEKHLRAARLLTPCQPSPADTAQPELLAISRKLVEVFHDILALKARS